MTQHFYLHHSLEITLFVMKILSRKTSRFLGALTIGSLLLTTALNTVGTPVLQAQTVTGGWLQVERLAGNVSINASSARVGDRLSSVGQRMTTGPASNASLRLDNSIGSIAVAQNTRMAIQRLSTLSDGARITILDVPHGQVRLQVRTFSNPNSRLELHTPSGVAAVRGTEFGVAVTADGKTSIATLEGQVAAIAQDVSVLIDPGLASIIHPGEPPTAPRPLDRDLDIQWQSQTRRGHRLVLVGQIDPANTLLLGAEEVDISRTGRFEVVMVSGARHRLIVLTVRNPMGESRTHHLRTWQLDDLDR